MTRLAFMLLGLTLFLSSCKPQTQASGGSSRAKSDPITQLAQTVVDQTNQGRACTTFAKKQLETVIDAKNPEFAKRQVLIKHGVVTAQKASGGNGVLDWQIYTNADLKEADGKGVFIEDGPLTYYCFGRWHVLNAVKSDKFEAPEGKQLLIANVELVDAVPWVTTDPDAQVLAEPSMRGDPAYQPALNEFDKLATASFTKSNQMPIVAPKE